MKNNKIESNNVAQYFSKNLQQVGFSSPTKAVLTTIKESVDNSLDACEDAGILPTLDLKVEKMGPGASKNTELVKVVVVDNGPGIEEEDISKVFGQFLASSKFGRGRCSRGQQGIGISAATAQAQQTNSRGAVVISKTKKMKKAIRCIVEVDTKNNTGILRNIENISWDRESGVSVEFILEGKVQVNGESGLLTYINGSALVNPHMTISYTLPDSETVTIERVSDVCAIIPESTEPHPHTMKLGEFISFSHLFQESSVSLWLRTAFSRVSDSTIKDIIKKDPSLKSVISKKLESVKDEDIRALYSAIQGIELMAPSTRSVLTIGEEALSKSVKRLGDVDFFSVVTRKPTICDHKPVQVEVAISRIENSGKDSQIQVLRFANRVPLQFDKSACAIVKAIESVNWRSYGIEQSKESIPIGPYAIAVSIVSPFIKFKNASKETIDASDELIQEIRLALIQAGQKLSKFVKKEAKAAELEAKIRHMEQFSPILVKSLIGISKEPKSRRKNLEIGLKKILGRDTNELEAELQKAEKTLDQQIERDDYEA